MTKLYKLTTQDNCTRKGHHNETVWGENVTHSVEVQGNLCTNGIIHAYEHPIFAIIYNDMHADISNPKLWEAEGIVQKRDTHKKCGTYSLTTIRQIEMPTSGQIKRFAILCALEVYSLWEKYDVEAKWKTWADAYLNGDGGDAAADAAAAARAAAAAAARAAADAAWAAAADAALTADARAAADAAWAAAADAAWAAAADAAWAAAAADALAAADAAAACNNMISINFVALAEKAMG